MNNGRRRERNENQAADNRTSDDGVCNVLQAQMCASNASFPSKDDGLYCR